MVVHMGGSPAGSMVVVVATTLGRVGDKRCSGRWLGRSFCLGSDGAPIRTWGAGLVAVVLKTLWWHGGATE